MKAWENDIATLDKMGYPEVAKAFQEYDKFVSSGMLLWGTNVGKAAAQGEVKKRGFNIVLDGSTTRASHSLFDVVINSAKAGTMEGKSELQAIKRIVGDRGYQNGLGTYINDAFDAAISEKEGIQFLMRHNLELHLELERKAADLKIYLVMHYQDQQLLNLKHGIQHKEYLENLMMQFTKLVLINH